MQKKFSTIREKQVIENSQNGLGPFLQAVRGSACALRREPKEKKNQGFGRLWHRETDFFLKEVSAATPILSARDPSAMAQSLWFYYGEVENATQDSSRPSLLRCLGGGKFPLILLLKPQFWRYSSAAPPFWRPIPRDPWRRCWTHQPRR